MERYLCPLEATLSKIGGKYKMPIIYHLQRSGTLRFGQLRKRMPSASPKVLTQQLRQLEEDGIIQREVYPVVPPRTDYSLTEFGKTLTPAIMEMALWSMEHMPGTFFVWDEEKDVLMTPSDSDQFMRQAAELPGGVRAAFSEWLHLDSAK